MQATSTPRRIRLSRVRGWRLPPGAVSVAYPTKWQNPFRPTHRSTESNFAATAEYCCYLHQHPDLVKAARDELAGLDLACWCTAELLCHADVLLRITAGEEPIAVLVDLKP